MRISHNLATIGPYNRAIHTRYLRLDIAKCCQRSLCIYIFFLVWLAWLAKPLVHWTWVPTTTLDLLNQLGRVQTKLKEHRNRMDLARAVVDMNWVGTYCWSRMPILQSVFRVFFSLCSVAEWDKHSAFHHGWSCGQGFQSWPGHKSANQAIYLQWEGKLVTALGWERWR